MSAGDEWEKFPSPEVTRDRLISVSMYITTFELLKESIIGRIRDFYSIGFNENDPVANPDYQKRVLSRNKSTLYASLEWLIESEAIEKSDIEIFERLKDVRNKLAHELPSLVIGGEELQLIGHFHEAFSPSKDRSLVGGQRRNCH